MIWEFNRGCKTPLIFYLEQINSRFGEVVPLGPNYLPSYAAGVRAGIRKNHTCIHSLIHRSFIHWSIYPFSHPILSFILLFIFSFILPSSTTYWVHYTGWVNHILGTLDGMGQPHTGYSRRAGSTTYWVH